MQVPKFAKIGDVNLQYVVEGSGDWIVLIGGFATAYWQSWSRYMPAMTQKYRVLAFDSRGSGLSDAPDYPYTTAMMANDTLGLMDHLGIDRAHILGRSLGGCIAQQIALNSPSRVRSLAMTASFARIGNRGGTIVRHWLDTITQIGFPGFFDQLMTYFYTAEYYETNAEDVARTISGLLTSPRSERAFLNTGNAIMTHDVLDRLKEISSPTILLCGAEDVIIPPRHAEEMGRRLPRADVHIIPRSAHGFLSEHPASFDLITGFFSRH